MSRKPRAQHQLRLIDYSLLRQLTDTFKPFSQFAFMPSVTVWQSFLLHVNEIINRLWERCNGNDLLSNGVSKVNLSLTLSGF